MHSTPDTTERFRLLFEALGINANEAANKIGESNAKFYNLLNGKAKPSYTTIVQLCEAYPRINTNWLIKGKPPILHTSNAEILADTASEASIITLQQYQTGTYDGYHDSFQLPIVAEERANYSDSIAIRLTN